MIGGLASIIIVTQNRLEYTKLCLNSIFAKTDYYPYEIIVIDNYSIDGTQSYLNNLVKDGKIQAFLPLKQNYGAGKAFNEGVKLARGEYLIRSDNDMVYNSGWLTQLIAALKKIPKALLQVAVFGEIVTDGRRGGFSPENAVNGVVLNPGPIGGCNMALTRQAYLDLGPFSEQMFAEDGDYCQRAIHKGYIIGQIDNAAATHIDHPTCQLSRRYTDYAIYRLEMLQKLKMAGLDFLCPEDREFYEKIQKKGVYVREKGDKQMRILYITSGLNQLYPHRYLDQFISSSLGSLPHKTAVFYLNRSGSWLAELFAFIKEFVPEYVFTIHGVSLSPEIVAGIKSTGAKTGVWFVDDPYDIDESKFRLYGYDFIFTNEKECIPVYQRLGAEKVYYLSLGTDTGEFFPELPDRQHFSDICFIGTPFPKRVELLKYLAANMPDKQIKVIGPNWPKFSAENVEIINHQIEPKEIRKYYNGAKINLNIHRDSHEHIFCQNLNQENIKASSPNNRTFDIAACRAFQLVDFRSGLKEYFTIGSELITFTTPADLVEKATQYLQTNVERFRVANNAYQRVVNEDKFAHRLLKMLEIVMAALVEDRKKPTVWEIFKQGKLFKGEQPQVYWVYNGRKHLIPSEEIFFRLGGRWESVEVITQVELDQIPSGVILFI